MSYIEESGRYEVYVDFDRLYLNNYPNIVFSKYDNGTSKVRVYLKKGSSILDLNGLNFEIKIMKSNYELVKKNISEINIDDGYVEYIFNDSEKIIGIGYFQIVINDGIRYKITPKIRYKVI